MLLALLQAASAATTPEPGASPEPSEQDEVVVVGSRIAASATVSIPPEEIEEAQPSSLLDVLDRAPGVRAVSTGGPGGTSFVSIRGGEPNFSLVLIDGVRVNNPSSSQGGGFDFAQLDPTLVERIAIVPSAASAIHGSDALSGVISLTLRRPRDTTPTITLRALADSDATRSAGAAFETGWSDGGMLLSAGGHDSDDLAVGSQIARAQGLIRATHEFGRFAMSGFALHAETRRRGFPESSGGPRLAVVRDRERRDTGLTTTGMSIVGNAGMAVRPRATLGWTREVTDLATPAIAPGIFDGVPAIASRTTFDRLQASADTRVGVSRGLTVAAGADYVEESGGSDGTIDFGQPVPTSFAIRRDTVGLFAEATWSRLPALSVTAAGRYDILDHASEITGRGAVRFAPRANGPVLFASIAEGFKRPSLYALAFPLTANPELRPERSVNLEAGAEWTVAPRLRVRASWFETRYRDLIDFDPDLFQTVNRSRVDIEGAELFVEAARGSLSFDGSVTRIRARSAVALRSRPEWQGGASLRWSISDTLWMRTSGVFNSDLLEASVPTGVTKLEGHHQIDAHFGWQFSKALTLNASLRNVTDQRYEVAIGFPAARRSLQASIMGRFF